LARSAGLAEKTQWRFQYGAVPKAMGLTRPPDGTFSFDEQRGMGFTLHIEEVGLAEPQVINALLKLRGKRGQLAEEIQLWENGGKKIKAGPKFWVFFSTNPPEEYLARNEVDPSLARGVVFKRMGELSEDSLHLAADYYFTYKLGEKPEEKPEGCILDIYNHPEIGREISKVVSAFHNDLNKELKKGEKGRQQRIPLTLDDMARIADALVDEQIRDKKTGLLDLTETLKELIHFYYLNRLADQDLIETMTANLKELLSGDTGKIKFEGEIKTRKEVFDILVERASFTEEEKKKKEEAEKERKIRESQQRINEFEDMIVSIEEKPRELSPREEKRVTKYFEELKGIKDKVEKERFLSKEDSEKAKKLIRKIERIYSGEITPFSELFNLEINKELAKNLLENLKKTRLWDKERKQWNWHMDEKQELKDSNRDSDTQLLGILAEAERQ